MVGRKKQGLVIELKPHGSYLLTDSNGFVIPIVSKSLIQDEWKPLIDEVMDYYKEELGKNLHSVYIRGSVVKGEAIPFISDLDSFCVVNNSDVSLVRKEEFTTRIKEDYPFCEHVELVSLSKEEVFEIISPRKRGIWEEVVKTQSVCVYGDNLANSIKAFSLKEMIGNAYFLEKTLEKLPSYFEEDKESPSEIANSCVWICRRILRSAYDLVMEEEKRFTRDLYLCWESFSTYYPEQKTNMYAILNLSLNPISDVEHINTVLNRITPWLVTEINRKLL